ncbi:LiaF domain-containing protein, partial [Nocardioides sp.]
VWEIGATHTAFTLMGGVDLDLRQAHFTSPEVVITANAVMGGVDIIVNQWTRISVEGVGIMGDFSQSKDKVAAEIQPNSPLVRVKGIALMGAVNVQRKPMPGEGPASRWLKQLGF